MVILFSRFDSLADTATTTAYRDTLLASGLADVGWVTNYLQWSDDVGAIETAYTLATTGNVLQRTTGVKNAGVTYANEVAAAILAFENGSTAAQSQYFESLLSIQETAAEKRFKATRDQEIALADAELQKQLTGNETAYNTAVTKANAAYESAITSAESTRTAALKTASAQRTTALAQITKTKDSAIAQSERTYDQVVAALDAQYGSSSSNGDTGLEGARRDAAISTRDAQYYATRDTSWASSLSSSSSLGTSPWIIKERTAANAQAVYSTSRATAQAAHDTALLSAIDNWQTSNRASTLALLLAEGQSREAYNNATAKVYANWEMGIGSLLGDKPEGTGYIPVRGYGEGGVGAVGGARRGNFTRFEGDVDETTSGEELGDVVPPRPTLPPSEESESQLLTVTAGPANPPGPGKWILVRGKAPESCLSGKPLYCVGKWQANDSESRNWLLERGTIDQLRPSNNDGQDDSAVQPPRVDVIFLPLDQFPSLGRAYFEDDILVADSPKDIAIAAGFDPSKKISICYETSQKAYPLDRLSVWTDGNKTLWALESRYVKNGVSVHCGYQFFSSPEEMYRQIHAMNFEIFSAGATAMGGAAGSLKYVKPLTRANPLDKLPNHAIKVSPNVVNPAIPRVVLPPSTLFGGVTFQHWGRSIVSWGVGAQDALARMQTLTKEQIAKLAITRAQTQAGLEFYKNEMMRNPGNATAAARVKLMEHILSNLD